jgi:YHS domain-containing protein
MQVHCEICATSLPRRHAAARVELAGRVCYFCCEACRRTFREHPDLFGHAFTRALPAQATGTVAGALQLGYR